MQFGEAILKKLFGSSDVSETERGVIKRDDSFNTSLQSWRNNHLADFLIEFRRNISLSKSGLGDELNMVWLDIPGAQGFQFRLDMLESPFPNSSFAIEFIKAELEGFGYQVYNSGYEIDNSSNDKVEWYYLKTPLKELMKPAPYTQLYGNIRITVSDKSARSEFKLLCTSYSDRNYKTPQPFDELVDRLIL